MGSPRDPPVLRKWSEKKVACRFFSGIENRARASAGARFPLPLSRVLLTELALELSMALLAPVEVLLGIILASLLVLLVALRCLLGFSWPPLRSSWGPLRR